MEEPTVGAQHCLAAHQTQHRTLLLVDLVWPEPNSRQQRPIDHN